VCARCQFRHDTAERPVLLPLGTDDIGRDAAAAGAITHDNRGRCFIAASLNPENGQAARGMDLAEGRQRCRCLM
jgi:hypothetical protein